MSYHIVRRNKKVSVCQLHKVVSLVLLFLSDTRNALFPCYLAIKLISKTALVPNQHPLVAFPSPFCLSIVMTRAPPC